MWSPTTGVRSASQRRADCYRRADASPGSSNRNPQPTADPAADRRRAEPTPLPVSTVNALTLSADSFFLAPDPRGIVQVWKMRAGGSPPQPFTGSGSDVSEFAVSPDGNNVAYVVDAELWLQTKTEQPNLLARLNSFAPVEADFSSDSTQHRLRGRAQRRLADVTRGERAAVGARQRRARPTAVRSSRPMAHACWSMCTVAPGRRSACST